MDPGADRVVTINGLLDFILLNVRKNSAKLKNYQAVPVPDLEKKLTVNLLLTTLTASLTATQGTLSDLRTIRRVGDVTITSRGNTLFVTAPIALDLLELVFHQYTLRVAMIKKSGDKLRLNIRKTFFDAFLVIRFDGLQCEILFEKFTMKEFNDICVDITGFSFLNPIAKRIAEWVVDFFNNYIIKEVAEEYARNLLNLGLSDKNSLQRLFGYAISGMVLASSQNGPESESASALGASAENISQDHPVAPSRQRRSISSSVAERQTDLNNSNYSAQHLPLHQTSPEQICQPNNAEPQRSQPNVYMNGSASPRPPQGSLRNNLSGRKNEIIIQPSRLFSSKCSAVVDVGSIPLKPPML